jgi:hypothetical protein
MADPSYAPEYSPAPPRLDDSELDELAKKISASVNKITQLYNAFMAPLPTGTDDGTVIDESDESQSIIKKIEQTLTDFAHLDLNDIKSLVVMGEKAKNGEVINDKLYLMEGLIHVIRNDEAFPCI